MANPVAVSPDMSALPALNDAGQAVAATQTAPYPTRTASAQVASAQIASAMPATLAAFDEWLASHPALPGREWSAAPVWPSGPVDAPLMILSDAPDLVDFESHTLFSGSPGRLLDAMLSAIGYDRAALRIGSIAFTRPPAGRIDETEARALVAIAHHHIAVARPRHLLLLGQQTCQLLTGDVVPPDGRGQRQINHSGAKTAAIAVHHPRLLIERPLLKRSAWTALKCLKEQSST